MDNNVFNWNLINNDTLQKFSTNIYDYQNFFNTINTNNENFKQLSINNTTNNSLKKYIKIKKYYEKCYLISSCKKCFIKIPLACLRGKNNEKLCQTCYSKKMYEKQKINKQKNYSLKNIQIYLENFKKELYRDLLQKNNELLQYNYYQLNIFLLNKKLEFINELMQKKNEFFCNKY